MKSKALTFSVILFLLVGILAGFSYFDNSPKNSSRMGNVPLKSVSPVEKIFQDQNTTISNPIQNSGINYSDDFDGANDTNALKARGYKVYYRGTGPQGNATWFQGNPANFPAFNGPPNGYVSANFQIVTGTITLTAGLFFPR